MRPGFAFFAQEGDLTVGMLGGALKAQSRFLSLAESNVTGSLLLGRFHYVDEFRSGVGIPRDEPYDSHAALALAAYRAKGIAALERLEGEFSLLIWDLAERKVIALRDPLGNYPLFWSAGSGRFALSTSPRPLLDMLPGAALDTEYLADYFARPTHAMQEMASEVCCYHGLHRVMPGTMLTFSLPNGEVSRRTYWDWPTLAVDPGTDRTEAIGEQVGGLLRAAVRERVVGNTASHFSGGMDSTSVALLARDCAQQRGDGNIHSLSLVYDRLPLLSGEAHYVHEGLRGQRGITSHFIGADDLLAYDSFDEAGPFDEPNPGLVSFRQDVALLDMAATAESETVLTGEAGDDLLDVPPYAIANLLRSGRFTTAWKESTSWARALNVDPWTILHRYGTENLIPPRLRAGVRAMFARGRVDWRRQGPGTTASWILPGFADKYDVRSRSLSQLRWFWNSRRDIGLSLALAGIQCRVGDHRRWSLANPRGMALSHPFLDARLVRLGLGIRVRYRQDPAQQKPLLAHATRGVLPDQIRTRRAKTHFNEVHYKGLGRNRVALERMIHAAPIDDLAMIDKKELIDCLRQTALGAELSGYNASRLDSTLSLVHWLSMERTVARGSEPVSIQRVIKVG